ncbi:L-threonylcarbamoyladenylate synthase [Desulfolithobacter sp.]
MKNQTTTEQVEQAVSVLRRGGVVAFPTETYYGLAVDPFNDRALERLFSLKKRAVGKPVLVLVREPGDTTSLVASVPAVYEQLISLFWPGPLTLIFPARPSLSHWLTGGTGTIGIRQSPHPVALALVTAFGGPITATSANISGLPPASSADMVRAGFGAQPDFFILDGGRTTGRLGSTLVGLDHEGQLWCLREGTLPLETINRKIYPREVCRPAHPHDLHAGSGR